MEATTWHANGTGNGEGNGSGATPPDREPCRADYPCPPAIWIGPWADVANFVGIHDWRVWTAVTAALSARAHRNVHCAYYGPLYGMGYYLLVADSAYGKSLVTRLCKTLLGSSYAVFRSVESGQALAEKLARVHKDATGHIDRVESFPSALLLAEWTMLLRSMDFHGSSLLERFCEIADAEDQVDLVRVHRKDGGSLRIPNPTLTICATTTRKFYTRYVNERHLASGYINRHLVLPGDRRDWRYSSGAGEKIDFAAIAEWATAFFAEAHTFGMGAAIADCYEPDAYLIDHAFGTAFFEPIHNGTDDIDAFTRLHVYNRRLAALYAWADHAPKIQVPHVLAANAVVRTSYAFLTALHLDFTPDLTPSLRASASLDDEILAAVRRDQPIRKHTLCEHLKRHGGYANVSHAIQRLIASGALLLVTDGKKKLLRLAPDTEL